MSEKPIKGEKRVFLTGNEVVAWAAVAAEADIMFGYPITPQNEIMHYWTRMAPRFNKRFLQTEDEISAGFTTNGGVLAGLKAFTATAGPGNTLMQEPISMAEMMRLPVVTIVQQRGGPSSATVIYSQQEVTLTTHGGNGEGMRVVYSTASHQELYDYTIKAFNTAWKYRFPTFVLGDGYQAKMREPLTIYDPEERGIEVVPSYKFIGGAGKPGVDRPPVQLRNIYNMEEELLEVLEEQFAEFGKISPDVAECEYFGCEDAEIVVTAHGVVARGAKSAVKELREHGLKVGYFRPITLRPLAVKELRDIFSKAKKVLVAESANGQLDQLLKYAAYGLTTEMVSLFKPGVGINSEDIYDKVKTMLEN
ncbi:ferredoxin oxidoreductase [Pelotomaculum terephthalicicum JT]|uniref:ferredoxin oxidoreductase n=1 Tax=Pelotomaculum TaxID=191373 RepID=UPI0009D038C3|nr:MULTISPECIES: ferredoxin oxidoreductase [Pelotomaculum]MCG9966555.1 ferredoxin oxidoreductase [Pelotomaculum terephthalicicum JT]OPX91234.1 MAG: NADH-dependent phenylglyoxylate dehydrogenase subunit alpha [Pelotomaculum sp. PtaB.Bin117]OPY59198.1 MAG: NADH-dependent phenylglyoxylate dehydrogenase subunit alpha [Pelotomaculum sp. PtaU1.Bin065]